jgi:hypothetical protein
LTDEPVGIRQRTRAWIALGGLLAAALVVMSRPAETPPPDPPQQRQDTAPSPTAPAPVELTPTLDAVPAQGFVGTGAVFDVVDERGQAVAGATVELKFELESLFRGSNAERAVELMQLMVRNDSHTAGADGRAIVTALPKRFDGAGIRARATAPGTGASLPVGLTVRADRVAAVRLMVVQPRTLRVLVIDDETSAPIPDASVSARDAERFDEREAASTDEAGRCAIGGLGASRYDVTVEAHGHLRRKLSWHAGEFVVRLLPIKEVGKVVVTVLGPDGRPKPRIDVELYDLTRRVTTDESGRAEFEGVPVGRRMFTLRGGSAPGEGRLKSNVHVTVRADESADATLGCVMGTASLRGRVVKGDGSPLVGASVELYDSDVLMATLDSAGVVEFRELSAVPRFVDLVFDDRSEWNLDVSGFAAHAVEATWTVGEHVLRGRVVQPNGEPAADVSLALDGPMEGRACTDVDGRFTIGYAKRGAYRVTSLKPWRGCVARAVTVTVPSQSDPTIELAESGQVRARLGETDRVRGGGARYRLVNAAGDSELARGGSDRTHDSEFLFETVAPGAWEMEVTLEGRRARFPVTVVSGETAVVDVRLP